MSTDNLIPLLQKIDEKAGRHALLNLYYRGEQPLTFLAPEIRASLNNRLARVSVNVPRLLVDSIAERLRVIGFEGANVWAEWKAGDLDQLAAVAHREALILGDSFAIVWARDGRPHVTVESSEQMAVSVDPGTRTITQAAKRWETTDGTHAVVYGPDQIERYKSDSLGATTLGFRLVETIPNPLGVVPVVQFRNGGRLLEDGVSEMHDVLSLTDAAVKLTTDMLTSSEYAARPRRWGTGIELEEDADGNAVNPYPESDRMLISEDPASKFGQLPAADLAGYEKAIGVVMRQISAVSGLPEHLLGVGGDNPTSADAIRVSEASLTVKAEARQGSFGSSWEDVARLIVAVRDGVDPAAVDVQVKWADPSTRSVSQEADAVVKLHAAGILPTSYALARLGYTDEQIALIRTARRAEALDNAGTDLAALLS